MLDQEGRPLTFAFGLLFAASRRALKNRIPPVLIPVPRRPASACACSTTCTKGSTVCGCALPYRACFIAVAAVAVASGMWDAAGRAARATTDGQVTSIATLILICVLI